MPTQPFAESAVAYARQGWRVFKIPPGQKIPVDKWRHGGPHEVATNDVREVERRAKWHPAWNVGIATGDGLAVLDIDPQHGGKVPAWAPPTWTVATPNGGAHLYYRVSEPVRSSAGTLAPGVDVRGEGGMVLAPPSHLAPTNTVIAGRYEWAEVSRPLATIDAALLNPPRVAQERAGTLTRPRFTEGERHPAMLSLAGLMRSRGCELPEIQAALRALNDTRFEPRLDYEWTDKLAKSIAAYAPDHDLLG
jgi:putative DNA primase/helicase